MKSSTTPLPLLTSDVRMHDWSHDGASLAACVSSPGTWLVYPRDDAVDTTAVEWDRVSQLVLVESRWKHAGAIVADPALAALPAMRLSGELCSRFWRSKTERLRQSCGLVSTVECLHALLQTRAAACDGAESSSDHLDDVLLFFALRLRLILQEYSMDPGKCCPWCTEADRRQCVHDGNLRTAVKFHTQGLPTSVSSCTV